MNRQLTFMMQRRLGRTAVGPSTARGMGPQGTISAARGFLQELDLRRFNVTTAAAYRRRLDEVTLELQARLPGTAQHWGAARKFLNIFLRNCSYDRFISEAYDLSRLEAWMEVPLDSHVAKGIKSDLQADDTVPRWSTVIRLSPSESDIWQAAARKIASQEGIAPVHLDVRYWNGDHLKASAGERL